MACTQGSNEAINAVGINSSAAEAQREGEGGG